MLQPDSVRWRKRALFGKEKITYKEGVFVISCADVPVMCRIKKASKESPFLIIEISLIKSSSVI